MFQALKHLTLSRKFWMTIVGTIVVITMNQLGIDHTIVATVGGIFGVNIAGIAYEGPRK